MKRDFLMLAQKYDKIKHRCMSWYASEKLDGVRCFWDGGVSSGIKASAVPWANVTKHGRFVEEVYATGLWSRYGQVIRAPSWWTDSLPKFPLDGELTTGRRSWQRLSSIIRTHAADDRWVNVKYAIFDSPSVAVVLADGLISSTNFKKKLVGCVEWYRYTGRDRILENWHDPFYKTNSRLSQSDLGTYAYHHEQRKVPDGIPQSQEFIETYTKQVEDAGGEGLMLRSPISLWKPERSWDLLKIKTLHDMEGVVIGYRWAEPTDLDKSITGEKTDKLLGLMGSVRLRLATGIEFDLSGFTDSERTMTTAEGNTAAAYNFGVAHPGEEIPDWVIHPLFKRGTKITFTYRELSDGAKPKEARFKRKHEDL